MILWDYPTTLRNDINELFPMEASCNRSLQRIKTQRLGQGVGVSRFRTGLTYVGLRYTMYLSYCSRRDLNHLIKMYNEHGDKAASTYIPEAFLWRAFLFLAVTGLIMEKGSADPTHKPNENWTRQIVHRDLKPSNVFLKRAEPNACTASLMSAAANDDQGSLLSVHCRKVSMAQLKCDDGL